MEDPAQLLRDIIRRLDGLESRVIRLEEQAKEKSDMDKKPSFEFRGVRDFPLVRMVYPAGVNISALAVAAYLDVYLKESLEKKHPKRQNSIVILSSPAPRMIGLRLPPVDLTPGKKILVIVFPTNKMPRLEMATRLKYYPDYAVVAFFEMDNAIRVSEEKSEFSVVSNAIE